MKPYLTVEEELVGYSTITDAHSIPQTKCHRLQHALQSPTAMVLASPPPPSTLGLMVCRPVSSIKL